MMQAIEQFDSAMPKATHNKANMRSSYADEHAPLACDDLETWLHEQVGPAYDALKADPSRALTADQVRARLAAEYATTR